MANKVKPAEDFMSIRDLVQLCLSKWYWFVISLVVTLSVAVLYIKRTPSVYTRTASILIKDDTSGKSVSSDAASLSEFGLFHTNTNVNNEIIALQQELSQESNRRDVGKVFEILVEGESKKKTSQATGAPQYFGRTSQNKVVVFDNGILPDGSMAHKVGDYLQLKVLSCSPATLFGEVLSPQA